MTRNSADDPPVISTDFLVIGSGIAGLRAAVALGDHGRVLIVNKGTPPESASEYAQGGIAVVWDPRDSLEAHEGDTLRAGKGLCRPETVRILVSEGPRRVEELIRWGAAFDRGGENYLFAQEGGHQFARILRARGDSTGTEIVRTLLSRAAQNPDIRWMNGRFTADLLVGEGRCVGASLLSEGRIHTAVSARAVILATGGAGQVYFRTTNPPVATADGMAMAFRAGAVLQDMEFVQFHPTALAIPGAPAFLLSEAMRGEGGVLKNPNGEPFMSRYDPAGDLATRDIVSRAVWTEMQAHRSTHVFLDVSDLEASFLRERFPTIVETCRRFGLDITRSPIPVAPSAHFMIGGVRTDEFGRSSVAGLYSAGEVASNGVHGANRLASNSLLEGLVFGARAGESAAGYSDPSLSPDKIRGLLKEGLLAPKLLPPGEERPNTEQEIRLVQTIMWNKAGIIRDETSLAQGQKELEAMEGIHGGPVASQREAEFRNILTVGLMILRAARMRKNSLGVHYRSDDGEPKGEPSTRHIAFRRPDQVEGYFS